MPLTPEILTQHELDGPHVEVVDAANPDLIGITGRIAVETMHTFMVDDGSRVWQVPRRGVIFEFAIPRTDEAADAARVSGIVSKLRSDVTGGFDASQSNRLVDSLSAASPSGNCEGVVHVTVDGAQLLSRPALCTETTGDSKWR